MLACSGPRPPRFRCPALAGEPCPLAAGADAVVVSHPPDDERWAEVAASHATLVPGVPVCVEPRIGHDEAEVHAGAIRLPAGSGRGDPSDRVAVVALVDRLARHRHATARAAAHGTGVP